MTRIDLAKIAYKEGTKCFHGNVMGLESNLDPIIELFPKWSKENWDNKWCAAFVYYCIIQAGVELPVRHPNEKITCNFAGCLAWEQWATLPENQYYIEIENNIISTEAGDIILYDNVFCDSSHDHIGIVIQDQNDEVVVAEGNIGNISGIVRRKKDKHIRGLIRLPDKLFNKVTY